MENFLVLISAAELDVESVRTTGIVAMNLIHT